MVEVKSVVWLGMCVGLLGACIVTPPVVEPSQVPQPLAQPIASTLVLSPLVIEPAASDVVRGIRFDEFSRALTDGISALRAAQTVAHEDSVAIGPQPPGTMLMRIDLVWFELVSPAPRRDDVEMTFRVRLYPVDGATPEPILDARSARRVPSFDVTTITPVLDRTIPIRVEGYVGRGRNADFSGYESKLAVTLATNFVGSLGELITASRPR